MVGVAYEESVGNSICAYQSQVDGVALFDSDGRARVRNVVACEASSLRKGAVQSEAPGSCCFCTLNLHGRDRAKDCCQNCRIDPLVFHVSSPFFVEEEAVSFYLAD